MYTQKMRLLLALALYTGSAHTLQQAQSMVKPYAHIVAPTASSVVDCLNATWAPSISDMLNNIQFLEAIKTLKQLATDQDRIAELSEAYRNITAPFRSGDIVSPEKLESILQQLIELEYKVGFMRESCTKGIEVVQPYSQLKDLIVRKIREIYEDLKQVHFRNPDQYPLPKLLPKHLRTPPTYISYRDGHKQYAQNIVPDSLKFLASTIVSLLNRYIMLNYFPSQNCSESTNTWHYLAMIAGDYFTGPLIPQQLYALGSITTASSTQTGKQANRQTEIDATNPGNTGATSTASLYSRYLAETGKLAIACGVYVAVPYLINWYFTGARPNLSAHCTSQTNSLISTQLLPTIVTSALMKWRSSRA